MKAIKSITQPLGILGIAALRANLQPDTSGHVFRNRSFAFSIVSQLMQLPTHIYFRSFFGNIENIHLLH